MKATGRLYIFDSSSFIETWVRGFPPDIVPTLWNERLPKLVANGTIRSPEEVKSELKRKADELFAWTQSQDGLFLPMEDDDQIAVAAILKSHPRLVDSRKGKSGGDPFVIAAAAVRNGVVVTEEEMTSSANRPKIPDVCKAIDVECIGFLDFVRELGWTFR